MNTRSRNERPDNTSKRPNVLCKAGVTGQLHRDRMLCDSFTPALERPGFTVRVMNKGETDDSLSYIHIQDGVDTRQRIVTRLDDVVDLSITWGVVALDVEYALANVVSRANIAAATRIRDAHALNTAGCERVRSGRDRLARDIYLFQCESYARVCV